MERNLAVFILKHYWLILKLQKTRPPAKSRFGSVIERMFGTTNTMFIHNLKGNTLIMKDVRQVTKSVNPKLMRYGRLKIYMDI